MEEEVRWGEGFRQRAGEGFQPDKMWVEALGIRESMRSLAYERLVACGIG